MARRGAPLMAWAKTTGDVDLLVATFEDLAALLSRFIALAAVGLSVISGNPIFDAAGTIVIGVLILVVATYVGLPIRRLIAGSAAEAAVREAVLEVTHQFAEPDLVA